MSRATVGISRTAAALGTGVAMLMALAGCDVKHPTANLVRGKQLFVQKCGSCHTLSHAASNGAVGPNLDAAFRQDRTDRLGTSDIRGLVSYWIEYPNVGGVMPAKLVSGQAAQDVAGYVAQVASKPGQDSGALASAVQAVAQKAAVEQNGVVEIDADPTGQLKFLASSASGKAGKVTLRMKNMSSVPHDIAIQGGGISQISTIVSGSTASVSANLKSGSYTFYCSVDGHAAAGMKGTITIK